MNRHTAGIAVGVLAVVCLAMVLSVVYPFSTATPHDRYGDEAFSSPEASSFTYDVTYTVDGERVHHEHAAVTEDGARYWSFTTDGLESELYQPGPDADVYQRAVFEDESRFERDYQRMTDDDATDVLRATPDEDPQTLLSRENATEDRADAMLEMIDLYLGMLSVTAYDRVDRDGDAARTDDATVYEPRDGWYERADVYRVTDASGTVVVDESRDGVTSADVAWTTTGPADTYAHYLFARIVEGDRESVELTYEFDAGTDSVQEPDWVADVREEE